MGWLASNRDITRRKQLETEHLRIETQMQQAQKLESLGDLAGGIAHDFNNILTGVLGFTRIALDELPPDSLARPDLEQAIAAANRARELVQQILYFSRRGEAQLKPLLLSAIVKEATRLLRASLPSTVEIRMDLEASSATVLGDPTQVHQILMNLGANAAYAMREKGGILDITLSNTHFGAEEIRRYPNVKPGPYVRLSVRDTGHGMDRKVMERIFEPYFTTKSEGGGTGMGLSVVYGIVTKMGGAISVYSEPGAGSVFHLFFPTVNHVAGAQGPKRPKALPRGQERILLVDDENTVLEISRRVLRSLGYEVTPFLSSHAALQAFLEQPGAFDLVITDQTMPKMTGVELARKVAGVRPGMKVILCSGYGDPVAEGEAAKCGIRRVVIKPVALEELAAVVRTVLDTV
jgi:nitrogen-specific signal transduction histidine kinase